MAKQILKSTNVRKTMNTILLGLALGLLIGAVVGWRCGGKFSGLACGSGFGALIGLFAGAIGALIIGSFVPKHDVVYGPATLVAMRTADGVSGSFVWGSGSINSRVTYNFLYRNKDGSLTPGQVVADSDVHIIEDASLQGVGYWSSTYSEADGSRPIANWGIAIHDSDVLTRQEFRVPVGTVVQSFSVK
jgi:hypothetical protein